MVQRMDNGFNYQKDQRRLTFTIHIQPTETTLGNFFVKVDNGRSKTEYAFFVSEYDSIESRTEDFIKGVLEIWASSFRDVLGGAVAAERILSAISKGNTKETPAIGTATPSQMEETNHVY